MTFYTRFFAECGVITKQEWGGLPCAQLQYLPRPVDLVIVKESGTSFCKADERCQDIIQTLQRTHMLRYSYPDIGAS